MSRSALFQFPFVHGGVAKTNAASPLREKDVDAQVNVEASKPLAGMLLAAVLAAVLAVADQVIDTWANGHLLLLWVALWTVVFAALALMAPPLRLLANTMAAGVSRWSQARAQRRADDVMWRHAQTDSRVMNDIQVAMTRAQEED